MLILPPISRSGNWHGWRTCNWPTSQGGEARSKPRWPGWVSLLVAVLCRWRDAPRSVVSISFALACGRAIQSSSSTEEEAKSHGCWGSYTREFPSPLVQLSLLSSCVSSSSFSSCKNPKRDAFLLSMSCPPGSQERAEGLVGLDHWAEQTPFQVQVLSEAVVAFFLEGKYMVWLASRLHWRFWDGLVSSLDRLIINTGKHFHL